MNYAETKDKYERHQHKRSAETHEAEIATENAAVKKVSDLRDEERKQVVTDIADRTEAGKALTKVQEKEIAKSPAVRMLIKNEFAARGLQTHELYVDVVEESYKVGMGLTKTKSRHVDKEGNVSTVEVPVREDIKLKNRRMVANEISELEGVPATAQDKGNKPLIVMLQFDGAFENNDNASIEIGIRATPRSDTDNSGSPSQPLHNSDMRDKEWENPPGHGDSEVLVGETG